MRAIPYFASILLTGALSGFLAAYAWRRRDVPGSRVYAGLALGECLLALAEILSVLSPTQASALFWFRVRFLFLAAIPVFWLLFALAYSGRQDWLSKRLLAGMFMIPVVTQALLWSNSLHELWVKQEVGFRRDGPFWLAETGARIPGPGFLLHSFYSLLLLLAGITLLLVAAWRMRRQYRGQALLMAGAASTVFVFAINSIFNLVPQTGFNPFTPGIGLSVLLIALAVFRFQFLERAPAVGSGAKTLALETQGRYSLAVFLFTFTAMAAGIVAVAYLSYQHYERQFRAQVESQLASIAKLKVDGLQDWRNERMADAEMVYRNPAFSERVQRYLENPADAQAQAALQSWLDKYQAYEQYDRVFLLDVDGVERISSPAAPKPVAAHLVQEITAVLSAGQVTFLDFHRDTAAGPIRLALLVPVYAMQDERPLGLVVLRIAPNVYLYPYLQQWPVPSASAETALVRREEDYALHLSGFRFQEDAALNLRAPLEDTQRIAVKAVLGQEGIVEGVNYRSVPVIAYVHAVPDSPWFLAARVDVAEVYAPLQERLWQTVVFFGALLATSGAGLGLVWRQQRMRYYRGQVQAAQALRESEERYRTVADYTYDWEYWRAPDGKILYMSPSCERITGYRAEEFVATPGLLESIIVSEDTQAFDHHKVSAEADDRGGGVHEADFRILRRDGEMRWIAHTCRAIRRADGTSLGRRATNRDITERRLAEDALRESEERFRGVFENTALGLYRTTPDGRVLMANPALIHMLGYETFEELAQRNLEKEGFAPQHPRAEFRRRIESEGEVRGLESAWKRRDGTVVSVRESARAIHDESGRVLYYEGTAEDITERKRAEEALRNSEAQLSMATKIARLGYWEYDAVDDLLTFNDQSYSIFRTSVEQVGGYKMSAARYIERFLHPDDIPMVTAEMKKSLETTDPHLSGQIEHRIIYGDGKIGYISMRHFIVKDNQGRTIKTYGVMQDITERKRAEEAIRRLNEELEQRVIERTAELERRNRELSVLYQINRATAESLDVEKTLNNATDATLEALGIEVGGIYLLEPDGETLTLRVYRGVSDEVPRNLQRVKLGEGLSGRAAAERKPVVLNAQDYPSERLAPYIVQERLQSLASTPLLSAGRAVGAMNLSTRRVRAFPPEKLELLMAIGQQLGNAVQNARLYEALQQRTAELQAVNKELETFSYSVSHDLRAPLRALDGFSAALLAKYPDQLDEQGRHYLDRIRMASQRMGDLIDDLLNLSRVTRHEMTRQLVDLSALAREIAADLQAQDPQRRVEFVIVEGLAAEGDPHLLRIVLQNLLDNAWKFTGQRECAIIEFGCLPHPAPPPLAGEGREGAVYFVRDNGAGFDMAYAGKLFAPFQRLHGMREFPGTGIGLATVQRVVARHGGRVWAEAAVDQGATFYFTLRSEDL